MNIQITISEGMDVEISFQKTHILLPLTLIGTIPTYLVHTTSALLEWLP